MFENQGLKTNFTIFNATVQLGPVSNMGPVSPSRLVSKQKKWGIAMKKKKKV